MKVAAIQTNPIIGDFSHNIGNILKWVEKAKKEECDLAVFPEMAISGYPPQDFLERQAFLNDHDSALKSLVDKVKGIAVLCGAITRHTGGTGKWLHNSAVLFAEGEILFTAHKRLLPTYDVFDESRYFEPGNSSETFAFKGTSLGVTICEDIWNDRENYSSHQYAVDPVSDLMASEQGPADLMINLAASPFRIGIGAVKRRIFSNKCLKHRVPLLYVNQVGGQDSLLFEGQSLCMNSHGRITARGQMFQEDMLVVDTGSLHAEERTPAAESDPHEETAAVLDALVMGTRDYVQKCGFKKAVLGLSGGIDSAVTAVIATKALGSENVLGVALPSPYSSGESVEDAKHLAEKLKIGFKIIPINTVFDSFLRTLDPVFESVTHDITEQNLQARIRGNLLMAISNKFGYLLLSTGNKSEMAVGYCTLYGDMSGGLAVIADVPKLLVYKIARCINKEKELIPWRSISKPPSAELAPDQKDQDDLPAYEVLDPILSAYLEENKSIKEIVDMGFEKAIVDDVVRRVKLNEYKRKQAPMGLKVTSKAFGYGRRYPNVEHYSESV